MSAVVRIRDLEVGFQKQPLLSIENLIVNSGEVLAITGPSGIGKTSLLKTIAGLLTPLSGLIQVCGATSPQKPPRGTIGYVPQKLGLVRHSSVWANVMLGSIAGNTKLHTREQSTNAILAMGLEEKIEPNRPSICILGTILGFMLGIFIVLIREFLSTKKKY